MQSHLYGPWKDVRLRMKCPQLFFSFFCTIILIAGEDSFARGSSHFHSYSSPRYSSRVRSSNSTPPRIHYSTYRSRSHSNYSAARPYRPRLQSFGQMKRDKHGKIARSQAAKNNFKKAHPCPSTGRSTGACPGYVIDHVRPLKRGGPDVPSNMQWQTTEEGHAKDKWE